MAVPTGAILPPPTPWRTRNATNAWSPITSPQSADATVNTPSAARNVRFVPNRSPIHPEDRGIQDVHESLTAQGRKRLTEARALLANHVRERTAGFTAEERAEMLRLLKKLAGE